MDVKELGMKFKSCQVKSQPVLLCFKKGGYFHCNPSGHRKPQWIFFFRASLEPQASQVAQR